MNWFDDLFGSMKEPKLKRPYFTSWMKYSGSGQYVIRNTIPTNITCWVACLSKTISIYQYGKVSVFNSECHIITPCDPAPSYPNKISISDVYNGIEVTAKFNDASRPLTSTISCLYNGTMTKVYHMVMDADGQTYTIYCKPYQGDFDVLSTDFVSDPITKVALMSALNKPDILEASHILNGVTDYELD